MRSLWGEIHLAAQIATLLLQLVPGLVDLCTVTPYDPSFSIDGDVVSC